MNFEQLIWRTDEPLMNLSMTRGSSMGRAEFRSQNYYNQDYFERMQYFDTTHPLVSLRKAAQSYGTDHFPLDVYASYISKSLANTRSQIIELAKLGFVVYDSDSEWITVQPRLYTFLHAAAKLTDFDVIDLRSIVNAPMKNATMDVSNYDLNIYGVEHFMVSDSQKVIITPNEQKLTLRKNRSIDINGRIDAGQIELYGDSLHFDYDTFRISLHRVDSLIFYVPSEEKDAFGKPVLKKVKNMLQKLTGDIRIDQPDNKSGRFSLKEYPILNSDSSSFVYYGSSDIKQGAYGNDQFYFEVDPFVMDSIDNFSKEQLQLSGRFASADIFDDMRQVLSVQPDYSLGFILETGDSAISAYGDAKLSAQIKLSSKGLEASGVLDYLTASIHADDIHIYPDSLNVPKAKEFTIKKQIEGTEFPEVRSNNNKIHWEPQNDRMYIYKSEKVFDMYEDTKFDGNLVLTSNGLSGGGRIDMGIADIRSDSTVFRSESFTADTSLFRLRTTTDAPYQIVTVDSVRSVIDFASHKGQFLSVNDYALVRFPANKFEAYIDDFTWHMDSANIRIGADTLTTPLKEAVDFKYKTPGEGKGIRYYSTIPGADSLNFVAESANFDYMAGRIKAEGVKLVQSANALIFPDQGKLSVESNGLLELGGNTRIVFNDSLKQHTVHSASINITGRKNFTGSGKYDYIDETGKITEVDILNVSPGKSGLTVANASLGEEDGFMISPYYHYQGRMSLLSENEFPEFDGAAQIVQECEAMNPEWFKFRSVVNPNDVKIEVGEAPVNRQNAKIYNGLFLTTDSAHIYPAFFSKRKSYSDQPLIQAHGQLSYDKDSMIYFIATEEKLNNRDTATGNMLAFNRDVCILSGEGRISLGVNLGRIKTDAVGRVSHHMYTKETFLDILLAVDFFFDDGLASMIASKIDSFPGLSGVDLNRVRYIRGMNEWLGTDRTNNFRKEAALGKVRNFPDELKHTLLFTQLNLQWNQNRRSYRSVGKIGIGNLFGHQVNRLVDGLVEISKRPGGGDMLDIYLKMGNDWFYFGYTRELMQIISSDRSFNSRLMGMSEKQRKSDERRPGFTYTIASEDKIKQFLAQMQKDTPDNSSETDAPIINTSPVNEPNKTEEETPIIEIE
ncbi:MAG: hypothetical protein LBQ60_02655 [Bacteroidales bacterium]|jgi:hypothetical protein|nr:hypothetical protein [Bacteroidales bacterium]